MKNTTKELAIFIKMKCDEAYLRIIPVDGIKDLDVITTKVIQNPGYFAHYDKMLREVQYTISLEKQQCAELYSELYCYIKKDNSYAKPPSDGHVDKMINNNLKYQQQKRAIINLEHSENLLIGVLQGLFRQLDSLKTSSHNMRSERTKII